MMFREPTSEEQAELDLHLRLLAWVYTRQSAGLGDTEPYHTAMTQADMQRIVDQAYVTDAALFYQQHRKDMLLQWLRMLRFLETEIGNAATHVAGSAALAGANYRELGAAWGISRQAARKKWAGANRDGAAPDAGDRVRLTYGDGSSVEGNWELTPDGHALRLDDGTLHEHVSGQVRREIIELAP